MSKSLSLYHINEEVEALINAAVDRETGEVNEDALEALSDLELARDEKALNVAAYIQTVLCEAEAVKGQAEKLKSRSAQLERHAESLRRYLQSNVPTGTKLSDERVTIKWSKSSAVVIDDRVRLPKHLLRLPPTPEAQPDKKEIGKLPAPHALPCSQESSAD